VGRHKFLKMLTRFEVLVQIELFGSRIKNERKHNTLLYRGFGVCIELNVE